MILGFEQYRSLKGIRKPDTPEAKRQNPPVKIPTSWNHLEGGVFDPGVSDVYIHEMPSAQDSRTRKEALATCS